jgi:hypothetical protein
MRATTFIIQIFCISPTGLFSCDSPNKQRVHPSATCCAVYMRSYSFNHWQATQTWDGPAAESVVQTVPSTCVLDLSVAASRLRDRLIFWPILSLLFPPSHALCVTHTHKWNFIIKHLFAYSWDSLNRLRRKAFRSNEPNADVYRSFTRQIYQYVIQIYNWTVCTMVS